MKLNDDKSLTFLTNFHNFFFHFCIFKKSSWPPIPRGSRAYSGWADGVGGIKVASDLALLGGIPSCFFFLNFFFLSSWISSSWGSSSSCPLEFLLLLAFFLSFSFLQFFLRFILSCFLRFCVFRVRRRVNGGSNKNGKLKKRRAYLEYGGLSFRWEPGANRFILR